MTTITEPTIPAPPEKPSANECCGGGCVPCIYDYYYEAMEKWQAQYGDAYTKSHNTLKEP